MKKCDVCNTTIPIDASQCPNCGAKYKQSIKPKEEKVEEVKPIKEKKTIDWGLFAKRIDIIAAVIGLIVFLSTSFDFSTPAPSVTTYHAVHSFQTLQERYPKSAMAIEPYYIHAITFHDEFCDENCKLEQLYTANEESYNSAQMETMIYYEGFEFSYGLYTDASSGMWSEVISVSLPEGKSKRLMALDAIATLGGIEYNELHDFYKLCKEGGATTNIDEVGVTIQLAPLEEKVTLTKYVNITK